MTTLAIVQARMTSTRFPGKVLAPLAGRPMILRQFERVSRARSLDRIVVATSSDASDDPLVEVLAEEGIMAVRGSLDDVLDRFIATLDAHPNAETIVRLTADCPLASPTVIDRVVNAFRSDGADYTSNTMRPTYPDGLDVEVVRADVLRAVASVATDPPEREHVTLGVYRRHEAYRVTNVVREGADLSHLRWTVDTPADLDFVRGVFDSVLPANPAFDVDDVLAYLEQYPERSRTEADARRNAALVGLDTGAMDAR